MTKYIVIAAVLLLAITAFSFAGQTAVVGASTSTSIHHASFDEPVNNIDSVPPTNTTVLFDEPVNN